MSRSPSCCPRVLPALLLSPPPTALCAAGGAAAAADAARAEAHIDRAEEMREQRRGDDALI
eukprot:gene8134-28711_t